MPQTNGGALSALPGVVPPRLRRERCWSEIARAPVLQGSKSASPSGCVPTTTDREPASVKALVPTTEPPADRDLPASTRLRRLARTTGAAAASSMAKAAQPTTMPTNRAWAVDRVHALPAAAGRCVRVAVQLVGATGMCVGVAGSKGTSTSFTAMMW